jgi:hypothetical protein
MLKIGSTNNVKPEGEYEVLVNRAGYRDTQTGKTYYEIAMVIRNDVEQQYQNGYINAASIWAPDNEKAVGFVVNNISRAVGIPVGTEFEDLADWGAAILGKPLRVVLYHDNYTGEPREKIRRYLPTQFPDVKHAYKDAAAAPAPSSAPTATTKPAAKTATKPAAKANSQVGFTPLDDEDVPF